jgi:uncharacterized membrane protein YgcG
MPEAYEIHEGRLIQEVVVQSAANALSVFLPAVPVGIVRTMLQGSFYPSVAETRTVYFAIQSRTGSQFPITVPQTIALSTVILFPALTQGLEIKLWPGDLLCAFRDVATAGSTCLVRARFIDNDLPYYSYEDPLKKVIDQPQKHASIFRGGGGAAGGGGGGGGRPAGGGGGGPKPI